MPNLDERVKTDVRFPERVMRHLTEQATRLGIPKNAYITMALCRMVADLARFTKGKKKRQQILRDVEALFQKTMAEAKRT